MIGVVSRNGNKHSNSREDISTLSEYTNITKQSRMKQQSQSSNTLKNTHQFNTMEDATTSNKNMQFHLKPIEQIQSQLNLDSRPSKNSDSFSQYYLDANIPTYLNNDVQTFNKVIKEVDEQSKQTVNTFNITSQNQESGIRSLQRTERGINSILDGASASLNSHDVQLNKQVSAFKKSTINLTKYEKSMQEESLNLLDKFAMVKSKDYVQDNIDIFQKVLAHQNGEVSQNQNDDPQKSEAKSLELTEQLKDLRKQIENKHNYSGLESHHKKLLKLVHKFDSKINDKGSPRGNIELNANS